ncbi:hypothetical protein [Rubripirellula reticaptiva]|uniref:Uncharacterized protein n=1 Tax=Rubripirellula reticaptiva TaxID=2528013 RepID=A0A5C6EVI0_9BACT|nr:hypothetical protein [Rubripirellula reticaptiva]TWU52017.1 hypothetical protein Poly59_36140 [Rubripirellula reticaptiva]
MTNNNGASWTTPLYSAGLMVRLGIGFVYSMIAVQLPNDFIFRAGQILLVAGVVTFVAGAIRLRKHLANNDGT